MKKVCFALFLLGFFPLIYIFAYLKLRYIIEFPDGFGSFVLCFIILYPIIISLFSIIYNILRKTSLKSKFKIIKIQLISLLVIIFVCGLVSMTAPYDFSNYGIYNSTSLEQQEIDKNFEIGVFSYLTVYILGMFNVLMLSKNEKKENHKDFIVNNTL